MALEPAHAAAASLRALLLRIGALYRFPAPTRWSPAPVAVPERRGTIDHRYTFGDLTRTLPLLILFARESASVEQISRCVPGADRDTIRHVFYMFKAFGILRSFRRSRGIAYAFDSQHSLADQLHAVLADLDEAMPQWRALAEEDARAPRTRGRENRTGRLSPKRWKW